MEAFEDVYSHGSVLLYGHKEEDLYEAVYQTCLNATIEGVIWVCYKHLPDTVRSLQSGYNSKVYGLSDNMLFIDMIGGNTDSNDDVVLLGPDRPRLHVPLDLQRNRGIWQMCGCLR